MRAFLHDRVPKQDGTWHRKLELQGDNEVGVIIIPVGGPNENGITMLDDRQVAKNIIKELKSRGWRVVTNELLPKFSSVTPEESTVLTGIFTIERLEIEHS